MKNGIYSLLKAKFLISDDALKNWKFIVFLVILGMMAIANNHQYDAKNYRITEFEHQAGKINIRSPKTKSTCKIRYSDVLAGV